MYCPGGVGGVCALPASLLSLLLLLLSHAASASRQAQRVFKLPASYLIRSDRINIHVNPLAPTRQQPDLDRKHIFSLAVQHLGKALTAPHHTPPHTTMTTIAEDLLNDFESDDENDDEQQNGELFADHGYSDEGLVDPGSKMTGAPNGDHMELEGDEEQHDDADPDAAAPSHLKMEDAEDEEEAKARIEKMQLASVSDVRSVAGLMRQLEPVMEVSEPQLPVQDEEPPSFTAYEYSPNTLALLAENRALQDSPAREADHQHRKHRRQPRI